MPKRRMPQRGYSRSKYRRVSRSRPTIIASQRRGYARVLGRASGALVMTPEKKYFDSQRLAYSFVATTSWDATTLADPDVTPVANMNCLFAPTVGSALNQRVGRKVAINKITLKGHVLSNASDAETTGQASSTCRLIMFVDKQTNGAQVTPSNLIAAQTASSTSALYGFQSTANFGRFRVLKDKIVSMQNPNLVWDGTNDNRNGLVKPFKMNIRFRKPLIVHFNATNGGTVADIVDNSIHIAAKADNITDLAPTLSYTCRVVYSDV